ncbi:DUF3040 domain-containing protein [Streptomyces purpureus]|uniref:DUF3040 domain-containing protein n=1 Tax=Streptomyces purpureus TaxID=1951 RepID=A0A918LLU8_9ACTN|nr:DUF3040 domain-containing protein [Streptomyces purpureus]GGT13687.1 hypothetical protein GCM10014713_02800 [Streptomyces purpureus]
MSHSADDQRNLAAIERALTEDDPALAATMDTLSQQFTDQPTAPAEAPAKRRDGRVVAAIVLGVIALLALVITAALDSSSTAPDEDFVRPGALSVATSVY